MRCCCCCFAENPGIVGYELLGVYVNNPKRHPLTCCASAAASSADVVDGNWEIVPSVGVAAVRLEQRDSNASQAVAVAVKPDAPNWRKPGKPDDDNGAGGGLDAIAGQSSSRCFHSDRNLFISSAALWRSLGTSKTE